MAIANLDADEKKVVGSSDIPDSKLNLGSAGNGAQSLSLVSESGMYTLILRCRDAVKKGSVPHRFRKWVTAEVLPAIRKTGKYEQPKQLELPAPPTPKNYTFELTEFEIENLVWFGHKQMNVLLGELEKPLEAIASRYHATVYSHHVEYRRQYKDALSIGNA